jgi:hypothetical protein
MAVVNTTRTFTNNEQITSTKLNEIMDNSLFVSGAVVPSRGLEVTAGGQLQVPNSGITTALLENSSTTSNGVTAAKIANGAVTPAKLSNSDFGDFTVSSGVATIDNNAITTAKIANSTSTTTGVTTQKIADQSITAVKLNGAQTGTAPIFGVRAWVNFQGTVTANISGTAVREDGSTTATITITNHGLLTGHRVYIDFGATITDSSYTITKVDNNTFTIVTGASTPATTTATVVLVVIRAEGNVSCVSRQSTGVFFINFTEAMPNAFYSGVCSAGNIGTPRFSALNRADSVNSYAKVETESSSPSPSNFDENSVIIIG